MFQKDVLYFVCCLCSLQVPIFEQKSVGLFYMPSKCHNTKHVGQYIAINLFQSFAQYPYHLVTFYESVIVNKLEFSFFSICVFISTTHCVVKSGIGRSIIAVFSSTVR